MAERGAAKQPGRRLPGWRKRPRRTGEPRPRPARAGQSRARPDDAPQRDGALKSSARSLNLHAVISLAVVLVLAGGAVIWAATTEIAGAVVAPGLVAIEGGSKRVQHPEGGIVAEINVKDDDVVSAGDLLVRLDGTSVRANLEVVVAQLRDAFARQARLQAESTGAEDLALSPLAGDWPQDPELDQQLATQRKLFLTRRASLAGQVDRINEQVAQLEQQIEGLQAEQAADEEQLVIVASEGADASGLLDRQLIQASRVNELNREKARLEGGIGRLQSEIAAARATISERRVQAEQLEHDFLSQVLTDLQRVNQEIAELLQKKIAAEDRLNRLDIRAPIDGVIHENTVETVGGVIGAGDTLMMVVPFQSNLTVDAHVSPLDIDRLSVGQPVILRLSSLDVRTTPDLNATIRAIAPDLIVDPKSGNNKYYSVRVDVADGELAKLPPDFRLVAGMPAEIFAQTGDRTVLSYLIAPLTVQMNHAFLEQ